MRRFFLSLILSLFVFVAYAEGISNYKELLAFAKAVNKEADISAWQNDKGVVCLKADIDMKKGKKFPTIKSFDGIFDGCGHKLYNWKAQGSLFYKLETKAVVRNLVIDASCHLKVETSFNEAHEYIAFITLLNRGQIINCENHGSIEHIGENTQKYIYIGGLAARNANIIYKCKNTGNISSRINFTKHKKGMELRMGGICGEGLYKSLGGATIMRCENTGDISYMGDYSGALLGGIIGYTGRNTVKYCINRGSVVAVGMPIANTKIKPSSRAAGIASWSNNDIICCDNFGVIAVSGTHASYAAGIVGRMNHAANITSCNNYGKISTNTSANGYLGGITAHSVQPIHLSQCYNFAEILSEGKGAQSYCGGIAGACTTGKKLKVGAFFRDCANYGKVINNVANKWSATAGILAYGSGNSANGVTVNLSIIDCGNYGEVIHKSPGPRVGKIAGFTKYAQVRGDKYDDFVKIVKPLGNGANIFGRVVDTDGMPVANAIISDGKQSVKTDVNGEYSMKSDMTKTRFVSISIPAEYEIPLRDNRPQFFRRIPRYTEAARADFVLKKRAIQTDEFVLAMIGDPQIRGSKIDTSLDRFRDVLIPDLKKFVNNTDKEVYAICLGDLVYNYMTGYDDYVDVLAEAPIPMVNVIGNHDVDQRTIFETEMGTPYYESYIGPLNYSFNIGKMHFVVVNNILYNRASNRHHYKPGLENYTLEWLKNDLAHVPEETTIVICSHAPLFKWRNTYHEKNVNYKKYTSLLSKYDKVYAWAGHTHQNYHFDYEKAPEKYQSLKNIESIVVARCIGTIRLNRELTVDGTTNGFMVANVKGNEMEWYYKTVGKDRDYQMRLYSPARTNSEYVKATIWNHSPETWGTPEWWENGVKVADMEYSKKEKDPDYLIIYAQHKEEGLSKSDMRFAEPRNMPYFFRVKPSEGVRSGEVRVTDNFGRTFIQKIEW